MGVPKAIEKMRCTILCLSLAIVYASAAPVDTVVPEDALYAQDDDFAEANNKIAEMQAAGASDKECRELTEKTKTDIKVVVENNQKIIDSLSTGQECHAEGQTEVRVATESLSKAKTTLTTAILTLTKAGEASVDFGSRTFSSLKKGECSTFFTHSSYVTAKARFEAATTAKIKAEGAKTEAERILKQAISTAASLRHKCLCKVQALHRKEYTERALPTLPTRRRGTSPTRSSVCSTTRTPASGMECLSLQRPPSTQLPKMPSVKHRLCSRGASNGKTGKLINSYLRVGYALRF